MALTLEEVRAIADYARIEFTDDELLEMRDYLNDAIAMLEPIRQHDLEGVDPTFHPIGGLANVMRADAADPCGRALPIDVALENAPSHDGRSFRVPSILGDGEGDR